MPICETPVGSSGRCRAKVGLKQTQRWASLSLEVQCYGEAKIVQRTCSRLTEAAEFLCAPFAAAFMAEMWLLEELQPRDACGRSLLPNFRTDRLSRCDAQYNDAGQRELQWGGSSTFRSYRCYRASQHIKFSEETKVMPCPNWSLENTRPNVQKTQLISFMRISRTTKPNVSTLVASILYFNLCWTTLIE